MGNTSLSNALPPAYKLGEYIIESVLGHGGIGITYLARDTKLSSRVAIKEYFPQSLAFRESRSTIVPKTSGITGGAENYRWGLEQFLNEAQALAKFKHNNIVRVLRFLEANDTAYMVMEYEEGENLAEYLNKTGGYLKESMLLSVFLPILGGLQAVHDAGMLHLDIKPGNIYLRSNGKPMLIDFGSARQARGGSQQAQRVALTPAYAAIEHYPNHGKQGPWTDVYSLGATLYRCVTGKEPLGAMVRHQGLQHKDQDPFKPAMGFERPIYTSHIRECVDWAMKLSAKDRPHTAFALQRGLMGHGMTNDKPQQQSTVSYRSGFKGISRVAANVGPKERKAGFLKRAFVGLVIVATVGVFGLKFLLHNESITESQLYDGIGFVEQKLKRIVEKTQQGVITALHIPIRRPTDELPRSNLPPPEPIEEPKVTEFEPSKILVQTLNGDGQRAESLAFLLDGSLLASSYADGAVKLWNVQSGDLEHTLDDNNSASVVAVSPNGKFLATADSRNTIKLWNMSWGNAEKQLTGHNVRIIRMAFSPDGRTLASVSADQTLMLWDINEERVVHEISGYGHDLLTMAFAPNGRRLATGHVNGEIKYWEVSTGRLVGYFQANDEEVTSIQFSPDGNWLASGGPNSFLKLWDTGLERNDKTLVGAPDSVYTVVFSPDSKWLVVIGSSDAIQIWDVETAELAQELHGYNDHIYTVALSSDGVLLAAGGGDQTVKLWR
ncbi:MAG: serine/threonine protein kinase [Proteobacteria bacterium]|nr:serine/threonine protein kinase [Pseudomonadota bacterium]